MHVPRRLTEAGINPLDQIQYEKRSSVITNPDGSVVFEMDDVEVPQEWSQLATDIMGLQPKQMAKPVRHETLGHTGIERGFRTARNDAGSCQNPADTAMHRNVQFEVVHSRVDGFNQRALRSVHLCNEIRENAVFILCVGSRDVGCVTVDPRARIDQETVDLSRRLSIIVLVVKDAGMFVERNDVGVG